MLNNPLKFLLNKLDNLIMIKTFEIKNFSNMYFHVTAKIRMTI